MWGYEIGIRIAEHPAGFGSTGIQSEGLYLDADSESLSRNIEYEEGANKLKGDRSIVQTDFVQRTSSPGGGVPYQPRSDNAWMLFMANLQCWSFSGSALGGTRALGTLTFAPARDSNFDWVGSTWGKVTANVGTAGDIYSVQVAKLFNGAQAESTNALLYNNCVVDALRISCNYGEDVIMEPTFKSYQCVATQAAAGIFSQPGAYGSFSTKQRLADWHATLTIQGATYNIQSLTMNLQNQTADRGKIGKFGWSRFPFGKILHEGEFTLEFEDPDLFPVSGTGTIQLTILGGTNDWIQITHYNAVWRSHDPQASSGDAIVEETIPYRAVMDSGKSVGETVVLMGVDITQMGRVSGTIGQ